MKYFMHYKNKPYKLLGEVKHSETLEDMVLYECLYNNPTAKIWVRPKNMFFENIDINGKATPRFRKIPITIESTAAVSGQHFKIIEPLILSGLGPCDESWFLSKLNNHSQLHLLLAYHENSVVGFKLGYAEDKRCFHSWLGAVLPSYRRLGVATELMIYQHNWCREQGFAKIRTKTSNKQKEMLLLNLNAGFEITGIHTAHKEEPEIILEKIL